MRNSIGSVGILCKYMLVHVRTNGHACYNVVNIYVQVHFAINDSKISNKQKLIYLQ